MHNLKQRLQPIRLTEEQKRKIITNAKKPPVKQRSYIPIILPAFIVLTAFFIMITISPNSWTLIPKTTASNSSESIFDGLSFAEVAWSIISSIELIFIYILAKKVMSHTKHWKTNMRVQEVYAFLVKPLLPKMITFVSLIFIWAGTVYFSSLWYSQLIFVLLTVPLFTLFLLNNARNSEPACCPHCKIVFTRKQIWDKSYMPYREKCDTCNKPIYIERKHYQNTVMTIIIPLFPFWISNFFSLHFAYVVLFSVLIIISLSYFYTPFMLQFTDRDTSMDDFKKNE